MPIKSVFIFFTDKRSILFLLDLFNARCTRVFIVDFCRITFVFHATCTADIYGQLAQNVNFSRTFCIGSFCMKPTLKK